LHWIIVLLLVALGFTIAEVMFPSFGMLGLLSVASYVAAIILAFERGETAGYMVLILVLLLAPASIFFAFRALPHTPIGKRIMLAAPDRSQVGMAPDPELSALQGKSGLTTSPLRPAGIADIDGRRVHVVAAVGFIDAGERVVVTRVEGSKVVVESRPEEGQA
jgi:membrane-bound serine protease (ClpP class)